MTYQKKYYIWLKTGHSHRTTIAHWSKIAAILEPLSRICAHSLWMIIVDDSLKNITFHSKWSLNRVEIISNFDESNGWIICSETVLTSINFYFMMFVHAVTNRCQIRIRTTSSHFYDTYRTNEYEFGRTLLFFEQSFIKNFNNKWEYANRGIKCTLWLTYIQPNLRKLLKWIHPLNTKHINISAFVS